MKKKFIWILGGAVIVVLGIGAGSLLSRNPQANSPAPTPTPALTDITQITGYPTPEATDIPSPDPTFAVSISTPVPTAAPTAAPTSPPANSPDRAHSSLVADNSNPTAGSQATLTVTLANSSGLHLSGLTINLSTADSGATFTNNGAVTDDAGQVKIQISSPNTGTDSIDVGVSGNGVSTTLTSLGSVSFQSPPDTPTPTVTPVPTATPSTTPTPSPTP